MSIPLAILDALVLAGGESRRMGSSKPLLLWEDGSLLEATVRRLRPFFGQVWTVCRPDSPLPPIDTPVVYDASPLCGPLAGLAAGLAASNAPFCFAVGCDMPFLDLAAITAMAKRLDSCQALALSVDHYVQPLHAFYRADCLAAAQRLLAQGETSLKALLDQCATRIVPVDTLPNARQYLRSLTDVDTPQQYLDALKAPRP
ncbi:MAG: molybdenum cofactor guanylyltransferase [Chloroflexi bacterium]|nr:molybdenum cofactor guanylyltransferase [Chloroflexota bacterium]